MIVTCAAILGVDFLTFPRKFCKSVNSGVTLMDLGVGGIIFTSGMVSSHSKGCMKREESLWASVSRAALHSGPLGIFGLIRLVFMSLTNLHWASWCAGIAATLTRREHSVYCFLFVGFPLLGYQIIIYAADLDEWMMEGPRTSEPDTPDPCIPSQNHASFFVSS
ncbi:hypothetical protein, conserved [Eimeria acervulina]|uniref:Uncharacterized protein n=1 Tax=Eimeria acervulina TaxID=5801 RepID=U6GS28_EIMAC|nr:hypothetical protein, conserved [Eimeria acervulina]CDI83021.1 hypothetical protein, conserved [Eimeria acervulina]